MPNPGRPVLPSTNELEQIRYALDQSAIVATTDVAGRIKYVNDKFCEISKYDRGDLLGQDHRILNSGYHSAEFIRGLWRTIAQGHVWRGEIRNRAKDGSLYWVDTTIVPFLDEHGKPWQYMAIRYDITLRKLQEEHLREQATLASLGEMAAVLAHEVRNPLAGIRGGVQLLGSLFPESAEGREFIGDIVEQIDSLNSVVGGLLTFARVRDLKLAPVDLSMFLTDIASNLKLDPEMREIELALEAEEDLTAEVDPDQLRTVVRNLVLNAAQAMAHRGRIVLGVSDSPPERIALAVTDTGPGIPVDVRDRVFEPFFTTKHRGTGLGLPTARRIVEAHGGEMELGANPVGGTIARIILPRRVSGPHAAAPRR